MVYTLSSSTWIHFFILSIIHDDLLNSALFLFSATPFQQLGQQYKWEAAKSVQYVRTFLAQALPRVRANSMTFFRFIFGIMCLGTYLDK